jgi:hypothetical protein
MKPTVSDWLVDIGGQFIEGASDGFLFSAGGSGIAQAVLATPALTLKQIAITMALASGVYGFGRLKQRPTPWAIVTELAPTSVTTPAASAPPVVLPSQPTPEIKP